MPRLRTALLTVFAWSIPAVAGATDFDAPAVMTSPGQQALEYARSGTSVQWQNPDTGATTTVVPQPAFQTASGQICREFQQTVTIGGQPQQAYGTACRQADGSWKLAPHQSAQAVQPAPAYVAPPPVVVQAPPRVVYVYPPDYPRPVYYYPYRYPVPVYYSRVYIGGGYPGHRHRHDRW